MLKEARINRTGDRQPKMQQRHLHFSGTKNFRDLGGYQTRDGKMTRWGLLYRSDGLQKLTERDVQRLSTLCLDRVIDFRSEYERGLWIDRLPADGDIQQVEIPILDASTALVQESREDFVKRLKTIDPSKYMTQSYIGFVTQFAPAFGQFFRELSSAEGRPVLFHCTAGKDRTGFAAALFLRMVGVPHETVVDDYLLTNKYFLAGHRWNLILARLMKGRQFADAIQGFMRAEARYLSVAFDTIDKQYGSFENYIRDGIGLSPEDIERFKRIYLK